ncbi:hypothetical protein QTN25_001117 [Entamoeba marina]
MFNFFVLNLFFSSCFAEVFYYPNSDLCGDVSTSSTEDSGGSIFVNNCNITFYGKRLNQFIFGKYDFYEFRDNSTVIHNGDISITNSVTIGNSFILTVDGYILSQINSNFVIKMEVLQLNIVLLMFINLVHIENTRLIQVQVIMFGSTYSDDEVNFKNTNNGIWIKSLNVNISENSIIRIYSAKDANYPINFVIDNTTTFLSYISIDNLQIIADNVTLYYSNIKEIH